MFISGERDIEVNVCQKCIGMKPVVHGFFCHLSKHVFKQFDKERHKHKLNTSRYTIDTDKNSVINCLTLHRMLVVFTVGCGIITYISPDDIRKCTNKK